MELYKSIVTDIKQKGYANRLVTYDEFLSLYTPYKLKLSEKDFATAIGIGVSSYYNIKRNSKTRAYILIERGITNKRIEEITFELKTKDNIL